MSTDLPNPNDDLSKVLSEVARSAAESAQNAIGAKEAAESASKSSEQTQSSQQDLLGHVKDIKESLGVTPSPTQLPPSSPPESPAGGAAEAAKSAIEPEAAPTSPPSSSGSPEQPQPSMSRMMKNLYHRLLGHRKVGGWGRAFGDILSDYMGTSEDAGGTGKPPSGPKGTMSDPPEPEEPPKPEAASSSWVGKIGPALTAGALANWGVQRILGQVANPLLQAASPGLDNGTSQVASGVVNTGVSMAGGAIGGAVTATMLGMSGPAGAAIGIALESAKLPARIMEWSEALVNSKQSIAQFSGELTLAFAQKQVSETLRAVYSAQETGESVGKLSADYQALLDELQPIKDMVTNVFAVGLDLLVQATSDIAHLVKDIFAIGKWIASWLDNSKDKTHEDMASSVLEFYRNPPKIKSTSVPRR